MWCVFFLKCRVYSDSGGGERGWWSERYIWLFFVLSHRGHAHLGWTMTPGKAENREKGLPMGSAHGDAMQCESMRLLWGCDCYSSCTVIWTTLTSQYAGLCSSLYPAMKWSSCVPVLSGKKINPHCRSHLIPLFHKLHPSSLMNVQSRYRSPCGSLEAFRWLLRTNAVSSVGLIPWKSLVVRADTTPHPQQQGWCDGKC